MKKIVGALFLILMMSITIWAHGNRDTDRENTEVQIIGDEIPMKEGVSYPVECVTISTNTPGVYAANLTLTNQYQQYQQIRVMNVQRVERNSENIQINMMRGEDGKVFHVVGKVGEEIGEIFPLLNLDLYGKDRKGNKVPIQRIGAEVTVSIEYQQLKDNKAYPADTKMIIYVFIKDECIWVPLNDKRSGVSGRSFQRSEDGVKFIITEWPVDDRMIASGG